MLKEQSVGHLSARRSCTQIPDALQDAGYAIGWHRSCSRDRNVKLRAGLQELLPPLRGLYGCVFCRV